MADTDTYGEADLLIADDEMRVWISPVSALGDTMLVSLMVEGADLLSLTTPAARPTVALAARLSGERWTECRSTANGGGGTDTALIRYATFQRPSREPITHLRVDVQFQGASVTRTMTLHNPDPHRQ
ncbi:hypothetical protein [Dactylosporangium sp. NPDC050588]|uniref:hypothetical protein n=1 Tax=Dactylosporangium sp. NPDC050588 TaxID=3157211 RepID=UPI0033D70087